MLKLMRRKTLTRNFVIALVIIALASYVLVSFGQAPPKAQGDTVTKVGNTTLKVKDVDMVLRNMRERFKQIEPSMLNQLVSATVINDAVMKDLADELGMHVSDAELRDFIIRFRRGFSGEGKYINNEQWAEWVRYNYRMPVGAFESYLRDNDLKISNFRNLFMHAAVVTESEVKEAFTDRNQSLDLEYATINTATLRKDLDLSDKNIKKIFETERDKFKTGPRRKAQYVYFQNEKFREEAKVSEEEIKNFYEERKDRPPYHTKESVHAKHILIKPVNDDKNAALAKIKTIKTKIDAGLSFEDAAKQYSEDKANASKGGDLGFATRDRWDKSFADAAFSLKKGAVSDPVESAFGFHLIKVIDKRPENQKTLDEVKDQIERQLKNRNARDLTREKATQFQEKLQVSQDFEATAAEEGMEISTTEFFDNDNQATIDAVIRKNSNVISKVFELKNINDFTANIDIGRGVVICKWIEESDPAPLDWKKDNLRIKNLIEEDLAQKYLTGLVGRLNKKAKAQSDASFAELASDESSIKQKSIKSLPVISKTNPPTSLGVENLNFETLYKNSEGTVIGPMKGRYMRQNVIAFIKKKVEPDFSQFDEQKDMIRKQLKQTKGMELMSSYVFAKRQELDPDNIKQENIQRMLPSN